MTSQNNVLAGTYEIIEEIGRGGAGIVYRAFHRRLQTEVVIKKLSVGTVNPSIVRQEADILKRIKHPYLPRVYDFIQTNDGIYTVMDYIKGIDMDRALKQWGSFNVNDVKRWALQLGEALDYLHRQNPPIIHSDIKPSNIMLTPEGNICLIDFNISMIMTGGDSRFVGVSAGFSPPEQYNNIGTYSSMNYSKPDYLPYVGRGVSAKSDIYSLGMCLMTFLTGIHPAYFNNNKIEYYRGDISEGFANVIDRMVEVDPGKRYHNGMEYLADLKNCHTKDQRYIKMRRKKTGFNVASTALIVVGIMIMIFGMIRSHSDSNTTYYSIIDNAETAINSQNNEEAYKYIEEARNSDSVNVASYREEVYLLYTKGDYEGCIEIGGKYLTTMPFYVETKGDYSYFADIYYLVGNAYYEIGNNAEAVRYIESAIKNDDTNPYYFRDYAVICALNGDVNSAKSYLDKASALGLKDYSTDLVDAEIRQLEGDNEQAILILSSIIDNTNDSNLFRRAVILGTNIYQSMNASSAQEEAEFLEKALIKADYGSKNMILEKLAAAYSKLAALNPDSSSYYYEKAVNLLEDVRNTGYSTYRLKENIGILYENMGNISKAEEEFSNLTAEYSDKYEPYKRLAFLEADKQQGMEDNRKDYRKMKEYYDKACSLCKDSGDIEMQQLSNMIEDLIAKGWL